MTRKKWNRLRRQHPVLRDLPSWEFFGERIRRLSVPQVMAAVTEQKLTGRDIIELAGQWAVNSQWYEMPQIPGDSAFINDMKALTKQIEYEIGIDCIGADVIKSPHA